MDVALAGRVLGGTYRLLDLVGRGASAEVYLARDLRTNAVVAIKLLYPHLAADPEFVRRFLREARLAEGIREPHIIRVLDIGQDADTHFLVLEYVPGRTLAEIVRDHGPRPVPEIIEYGRQILLALEAAHTATIVHRDIKPENLLVAADGSIKVADFGVASDPAATMTHTGTSLGTPVYMSPEQVRGERVDARSDLYSLAVTLYELVAGQPPFKTDSAWRTLDLQLRAAPPPLDRIRRDIPPALEEVIYRGLAKDPTNRYQSARDMRRALEAVSQDDATIVNRGGRRRRSSARTPGARWRPLGLSGFRASAVSESLSQAIDPISLARRLDGFTRDLFGPRVTAGSRPVHRGAGAGRPAGATPADPRSAPRFPSVPGWLTAGRRVSPQVAGLAALVTCLIILGVFAIAQPSADEAWARTAPTVSAAWERDWPGAIRALDEFHNRYPDHEVGREKLYAALVSAGQTDLTAGRIADGVDRLERAERLYPDRPEATGLLQRLRRSGQG